MSFDEQPDGDPHGECEAEIKSLKYQLTNYRIAHERQAARITRLEAENAEARELLAETSRVLSDLASCNTLGTRVRNAYDKIRAFLAKRATP